jgi:hypothetical protein
MWKNVPKSLREYTPSISKQWWEYVTMWGATIAFFTGLARFTIWAKNTTPPMPTWTIVLIAGGAIAFVIVNFLAFNGVRIERDKAKAELFRQPEFVPLSNRDELLRVITEARIATIELIESVNRLKKWQESHPNLRNIEAISTIEEAHHRQKNAYEAMEKEILVAGSAYEPILKPLYLFMQSSAILDASIYVRESTMLTYKLKLEEMITHVRNKITELSKPTSHKEGSQS